MFLIVTMILAGCTSQALKYDSDWLTDFEAARQQSEATGRPILIDFTGSDWCHFCILLNNEVFSEEAFKAFAAEHLVLLKIDFPRQNPLPEDVAAANRELAMKYGIRGYPTIILADKDGKEFARTGYRRGGVDAYIEHLKELLDKQ